MEVKSKGDIGIKTIGILTLLSMPILGMWQQTNYILWLLFLSGPAYLYFAILKYRTDKTTGRDTDRAVAFIIIGGALILMGLGLLFYRLSVGISVI